MPHISVTVLCKTSPVVSAPLNHLEFSLNVQYPILNTAY